MTTKIKNVHIFGGGTMAHISSHFAISAPAYGSTARSLYLACNERFLDALVFMELTKMAGGYGMETNEDVAKIVERLKANPNTKIIFFSCALVDWKPVTYQPHNMDCTYRSLPVGITSNKMGKYAGRIDTHKTFSLDLGLMPADKIIGNIRKGRKDIFLVGFKTTCGASKQEMFEKGLRLCKEGSANLVLVNDVKTHWNMIVTPEEAAYHETEDRTEVLTNLVDMVWHRSQLTFTQSTVVAGEPVKWSDERVPSALRTVVDHCIKGNAYKVFHGGTVGHFATRLSETEFLTSIRKSDFNKLNETGLVYVKTDGPDTVLAYGAKPSVGGQSQRIVFKDHPGFDCITHFHCELRSNNPDAIPIVSQRDVECGSHECGRNTSNNLAQFGNLKVVMLKHHGPNIVFPKSIDPQEVINFIERNFDLSSKTGGYHVG